MILCINTFNDIVPRQLQASQVVLFIKEYACLCRRLETWVWALCREDSLEKEMAPHSSIFAQKIPWAEESSGLQFMVPQTVRHGWAHMSTRQSHSMPEREGLVLKISVGVAFV